MDLLRQVEQKEEEQERSRDGDAGAEPGERPEQDPDDEPERAENLQELLGGGFDDAGWACASPSALS